jgi:Xaa-Pro aminopeptidase
MSDAQSIPEATLQACTGRLTRLREAFARAGIDALLVSFPTDIRYLTGFSGEDSLLLVDADRARIISDTRHREHLGAWDDTAAFEVVMGTRHRLEETVAFLAGGIGRLGLQAEHVSVLARRRYAEAVGGPTIVDTDSILAHLRRRKDAVEVAAIEQAIGIQQAALTAALEGLRIGMTELEFCALLEYEMKARGGSGASFNTIIGSGPNSAIIHHEPGARPIEAGALLVDWGTRVDGYCSDMTRTFGVGEMPAKIAEIYPIVLEAQLAAIDACRPGRTCSEIDAVARDVIVRAGYGDRFEHGLGHGVGLEIHEGPYFNDLETTTLLEPGMVMTVEPGIYLPGVGGVRIEDDVLITDDGCRVLSSHPKGLETATVGEAALR